MWCCRSGQCGVGEVVSVVLEVVSVELGVMLEEWSV